MKRREFLKVGGCRRGGGGDRQARHRAVDAGTQVAVARRASRNRSTPSTALRKSSPRRSPRSTDNKFQIQVFAAGEIVPGAATRRTRCTNGTVEMCHTASYYYVGKDPTFAFGTAVPFGLNSRMQNAWMFFGGGMELMNDFYKKANIYAHSLRQHRLPDGRLVPQGDQGRRPTSTG